MNTARGTIQPDAPAPLPANPPRPARQRHAGPRFTLQQSRTARRVNLLLGAMALMGLVDLTLTLTYMKSTGMFELNPIARLFTQTGDPTYLIAFKLITMIISGGSLYLCRYSRRAELCAWVCTAILVTLMFHWANYSREVNNLTNELFMLAEYGEGLEADGWVRLARQ